jgi:ribosomal protein L11 methylase PrmA
MLAASGRLIVSGVLNTEEADVTAAFESLGCQVTERLAEQEWIGLSITSPMSSTTSTGPR